MTGSSPSPRGKCRVCGKIIATNKNGRLRMHTSQTYGRTCTGSRGRPVEGTLRVPKASGTGERSFSNGNGPIPGPAWYSATWDCILPDPLYR